MEPSIRAVGLIINFKEGPLLSILMVVYLMVNGLTTRLMDLEYIHIKMVESMKGTGSMICKMVMDSKNGQMEVTIKVNSKMG
jgi:hypothetical protein